MGNSIPVYETMNLLEHEKVVFLTNHSTGNYVVSHWHDAMEIIYISKGDLTVTMADQDYHMTDDTFFLINSKVVHSTRCIRENYALVIQLPDEFLEQHIDQMDQLVFQVPFETNDPQELIKINRVKEYLRKYLRRLYDLYENQPEGMKLMRSSLLFALLHQLYCDYRIKQPQAELLKHTKNLSILKKVMTYSEEHHFHAVSIEEIANVAGLQPKYFCRFFKKNVGVSYLYYLNELRISEIYQELITTDLPLYQILERHGFSNYKLFRRMFKERFGNTPMQIRAKKQPAAKEENRR